ncbi:nucleoside/nucleotide kinase family protein [Enterococcus sp. LJL98]
MFKAKIIVISGVTAGGKTTLIKKLSKDIKNSFIISFDDYSIDALPSAPSLDLFLEDSKKAVNQYDIRPLIEDLEKVINQYDSILIDFPFGYEHNVLKPYIDKVIYLKTPLDIAFARQIIRDFSDKDKQDILDWAETYINYARPIFLEHDRLISSTADHILDGTLTTEMKIEKLKELKMIEPLITKENCHSIC